MNELYSAAAILNAVLALAAIVGSYIAIRSGKHQQTNTIQEQAISALQAELEVMRGRLGELEKENTRLEQIMSLIKQALRRRGLTISIEGDLVTIDDGHINQAGRISEDK